MTFKETRRLKSSYQTEAEQPGRREPGRHEDEAQPADGDGGPEDAVQAAGSLVAHQQRRGDGVGVDEAGVGALQGRPPTADQGPAPSESGSRCGASPGSRRRGRRWLRPEREP